MFLTIEAPFHAISDDAMKEKYIAAVNKLFADRESIIADNEEILSSPIYNTDELEKQKEYRKRYEAVAERFNMLKKQVDELSLEISEKHLTRLRIKQFLECLRKQKELVTEFDSKQFHSLVDFIIVYSKDDIRFTFRNGMEIKV